MRFISKTNGAFVILGSLLVGSLLVAFNPTISTQTPTSSCPDQTKLISEDFEGKAVCQISGVIQEDLYLSRDKYWALNGEVHVGVDTLKEVSLKIQEGTTIFGKTNHDFLVVNRGSKIYAEGTKQNPIVFTSKNDVAGLIAKPGEWGGIVIAGKARINTKEIENSFEFSKTPIMYGGEDDEDNSGVLRYMIVKYAGDVVYSAKELNGISLGGVGSKTEIDYVEVYKGLDDGIELWGGTVNLKHIVLIDNGDDNLDLDEGYRGMIQYLYSSQSAQEAFYARAIEADNNEHNLDALPRTNPIISHFEFVGGGYASEGVMLRKGAGMRLMNGRIRGFVESCLSLADQETLYNKSIDMHSIALDGCRIPFATKKNKYKEDLNALFSKNGTVGISEENILVHNPQSYDRFFEEADFVGAYDPQADWREPWSILR